MAGLINKTVDVAIWSIKVFRSPSFICHTPDGTILKSPTLQASDVTDVSAAFIADPFLLFHDSKFYLFFEVLDQVSGKGIIGVAVSDDGERWKYERIVLKEYFHLSYPFVFTYDNQFYMIPESMQAGVVRLYKATTFPYEWEPVRELIQGPYIDPTLFRYNKKWWMFAFRADQGALCLFCADTLDGDWTEHPKSPIITGNYRISRPAGRVIVNEEGLYRFAQDCVPYYGKLVTCFEITKLSESEYEERQADVVLNGSNEESDWRKDGMHHIDQLQLDDKQWLIAVDGHVFHQHNYLKWRLRNFLNRRKA